MTIKKYLQKYKKFLRPRTVGFLIKKPRILLGFKKRGLGQGNIIGIGGKVEQGETIDQGLIREFQEEVMVTPLKFEKLITLNFYFPYVDDPDACNQQVHAYRITEWNGIPKESEEIRPKWFDLDKIPFNSMWVDNKYWLLELISNKKLEASFLFDQELGIEDYQVKYL